MTVPNDIYHEENLGRCVYSRSEYKRARNSRIRHYVFLEKQDVIEISVDRLDHAEPAEAVAIADKKAAARSVTFYGWAVVSAQRAAANERRIRASPKPDNPYHADIVLPDLAGEVRDEQIRHAQELANRSSWRERPSAPGRS